MKKTVLVYGVIAGILCSSAMLVGGLASEPVNFDRSMYFGFASIILSAIIIWAGVASYKKNKLGGRISFGKAFAAGALMAFIASSFYVITWMAGYNTIFSGFSEKYTSYIVENKKKAGKSDAEIQKEVAKVKKEMVKYDNDAVYRASATYLEIFPIQLVIVLIASVVLSWKKQQSTA